MKTIKFRDLRADEIELRVGATNDTGFSLLLYKTARVDANVLDETVGAFNWQKRFYQVKNTMICEISINVNYDDDTKEPRWVSKSDGGDESNTEAIKGECSDAMKRASFQWNIGRALYSSPFIWIKKDENNDPKKSHYSVNEIEYTNGEISKLVITNDKTGQVVFSCGSQYKVSKNTDYKPKNDSPTVKADTEDENAPIRAEEKDFIQNYVSALSGDAYKNFFVWLAKNFGVRSVGELTASQGIIVKARLSAKK